VNARRLDVYPGSYDDYLEKRKLATTGGTRPQAEHLPAKEVTRRRP
jgi:hypothetical protein